MFLLSVLVVLMLVTTVATSLYLYFQALCQVLSSGDKWIKSCDMLSKNRFCLLDGKIRIKSPDHLFDLKFLHSMLYIIGKFSTIFSFFIWATEVPPKNWLLYVVLFFPDSSLFCASPVLQFLRMLFICKNHLEILRNSRNCWKSLFPAKDKWN